jgi:hypothetical protein
MAKQTKPLDKWEVIKLAKTGVVLGIVFAADEAAARRRAIKLFKVPQHLRSSFLVRKV